MNAKRAYILRERKCGHLFGKPSVSFPSPLMEAHPYLGPEEEKDTVEIEFYYLRCVLAF